MIHGAYVLCTITNNLLSYWLTWLVAYCSGHAVHLYVWDGLLRNDGTVGQL